MNHPLTNHPLLTLTLLFPKPPRFVRRETSVARHECLGTRPACPVPRYVNVAA